MDALYDAAALHTVTLLTGDVVEVRTFADGTSAATVERPAGADGGVRTTTASKDLYVYPDEAMPYVASGVLDKQLFNVTQLISHGYDDAHTKGLPLIVTYTDAGVRRLRTGTPAGATRVRALPSVQGAAVIAGRSKAGDFWSAVTKNARPLGATGDKAAFGDGISHIWLDGKVRATLVDTTAQIGAPDVWKSGYDGKGVKVAVLDTGVDGDHPDLKDRIKGTASFIGGETTDDLHGHGTHTASTVAGTGAASDGKEKGVAPGADLYIGKVLSNRGTGTDSQIIAGMEWAAKSVGAKVVSMSLGSSGASDGTDLLSEAVNRLSAETGTLFVVAAGNVGVPYSIGAPGAADAALTVGAVDGSDNLAFFSSQGPRLGDDALKPDLSAPGVNVLAARSHYASWGTGYYTTLSGTSMATPHVAGAAVLLAQKHPDWSGQQIKNALVSTAKETPNQSAYQGGSGRVDVEAAASDTVFATGSAYFGYYTWPHDGDEKSEKTITYTNSGDTDATLGLKIDAAGAPAALFSLSTDRVTVPAHGTQGVTLIADPAALAAGTKATGQVKAYDASGSLSAHTTIGISKERERYTLKLKARDRDGKPLSGVVELLKIGSRFAQPAVIDDSGELDVRVDPGTYSAMMWTDVQGANGPGSLGFALLGNPEVKVDKDTTLVLDGTRAHEVRAVTPKQSSPISTEIEYHRSGGASNWRSAYGLPAKYDSIWAESGTAKVEDGDFTFSTNWRSVQPQLAIASKSSSFGDVLPQSGSTRLPEGHWELPAVYAGQGATSDYVGLDVSGKVAVVRRSGSVTASDQAAAAVAAGAKLLLVVNDGTGRLNSWYGAADRSTYSSIAVASLTKAEGEELIAQAQQGTAKLAVASKPVSDYAYDLVERHDGMIPADVTYHATKDNLARVNVAFNSGRAVAGYEFRQEIPPYASVAIGGLLLKADMPGTRTDWVSTDSKGKWYETAVIPGLMEERSARLTYKAGTTTDVNWFSPVQHPRLNDSDWLPQRSLDRLSFNVPGWGDAGPNHAGFAAYGSRLFKETVALYQDDKLVSSANSPWMTNIGAPTSERVPYRLVVDTSRDSSVNPLSSSTHTEWTFLSGHTDKAELLPLIQFDYGVETDADGYAHRSTGLTVTPSAIEGALNAGTVTSAGLEVSYDDGATWQKADLNRSGTEWTARLTAPKPASYVSIRATATDSNGNNVTQTVIRAFAVK
ncbi:S8 family serine peptidase [Streptomyces sp. NPDC004327]|uniref:S8 family serine peptidase n=1 Tax=Streptomyces sp. NPDC004327 TaxID=3364699 RepID=UPI003699E0BA